MLKQLYVGFVQRPFKKGNTTIEVALYTKYVDIKLVYLCVRNYEEPLNISYIKMRDSKKKCRKYKTEDGYCNLCMEEKLAIATHK